MLSKIYISSLISGLVGVIVGIIADYIIQNRLQENRFVYELRKKLIYEIKDFEEYIDHLKEICCDDEEQIKKYTENKKLLFSLMEKVYQYYSSFKSACFNYNLYTKNKLELDEKIEEIQEGFLDAVYHTLFCPERKARHNFRKSVGKYKELFSEIKDTLKDNK